MLVAVDKKHEEFLCKCLKEASKRGIADDSYLLFIACTKNDELLIMDENLTPDDMALIATRLNTQATMDYVMEAITMMKFNIVDEDEEESESES